MQGSSDTQPEEPKQTLSDTVKVKTDESGEAVDVSGGCDVYWVGGSAMMRQINTCNNTNIHHDHCDWMTMMVTATTLTNAT